MLDQCWSSVVDGGSTLTNHSANILRDRADCEPTPVGDCRVTVTESVYLKAALGECRANVAYVGSMI